MEALVAKLYGPGDVRYEYETLPAVGDDDMLIKMVSVGLCHSEMPQYVGQGGVAVCTKGYKHSIAEAEYPMGMGHEAIAEVVEVGKNIKRFRIGDKVSGRMPGCLRTYAVIPKADIPVASAMLFKIPDGVENYKDCLSEPLECVVNIVKASSCKVGERIAVVGCGFMGALTIAGLKNCGASQLTAIDIKPENIKLAMELGATDCIDLNKYSSLEDRAYEITEGNFYDVVIEFTGSIRGLEEAMEIVRPTHDNAIHTDPYRGNAKIILPSVYSRGEAFPVGLGLNMMLRTPIMHVVHPMYDIDLCRNHVDAIKKFVSGELPIGRMITHHLPFSEVKKGYEWLKKAPDGFIKGVIDFE